MLGGVDGEKGTAGPTGAIMHAVIGGSLRRAHISSWADVRKRATYAHWNLMERALLGR